MMELAETVKEVGSNLLSFSTALRLSLFGLLTRKLTDVNYGSISLLHSGIRIN